MVVRGVALGGSLFKLRLSRENEGKSGGFRSIIALKRDDSAMFLDVFAKNDSENIAQKQLAELKQILTEVKRDV